jgi:hypothetical protein
MMTMSTRNRTAVVWLVACGALIGSATAARADYSSETGAVAIIAPPPSVLRNALQNDLVINTFAEHQDFTLTSSVHVDNTAAGTFQSDGSLVPGTIAAGTEVDSYFFHSDTTKSSTTYEATVTFTTPILGVVVLSNSLDATDAQLGAPGTTYPTGDRGRGLELSKQQDFFTISPDHLTITLHFDTHNNVDEIRVLTAPTAVPEPAAAALLGLGGLGAAGSAWFRRKRQREAGR